MRKPYFYILLMLFFVLKVSFSHAQNSSRDSASLESVLQNENTDDEEYYKETSNQNNEEIFKADTSFYRKIDSSNWASIKNDKAFNYKKEKLKTQKKPSNLSFLNGLIKFFSSGVLKFILFSLVALAIIYILYSLFNNSEFNYFKRRNKKQNNEDQSWENITEFTDWENALQKALDIPDYRLAVRVMYLETLQLLNSAELIKYEQEKTNWQYVEELGDTTFKKPFTLFTKYFDYVWYGNFEMTNKTFEEIKQIHSQLKQSVRI